MLEFGTDDEGAGESAGADVGVAIVEAVDGHEAEAVGAVDEGVLADAGRFFALDDEVRADLEGEGVAEEQIFGFAARAFLEALASVAGDDLLTIDALVLFGFGIHFITEKWVLKTTFGPYLP